MLLVDCRAGFGQREALGYFDFTFAASDERSDSSQNKGVMIKLQKKVFMVDKKNLFVIVSSSFAHDKTPRLQPAKPLGGFGCLSRPVVLKQWAMETF